jgi:uncharacterized protein YukE
MDQTPVIHPAYSGIIEEILALEKDIAALLLSRDELQFHICKNIEAEYMVKLGAWEYKIFEIQCKVLRLKREIELVQAALNKQETPIPVLITMQLDAEFADYQQRLNEQMNTLNNAMKRHNTADFHSESEQVEIKKLYSDIVKQLHPDINPAQTEQMRQMFINAVDAYKNADIDTMRSIHLLLHQDDEKKYDEVSLSVDALAMLTNRKEKLILWKSDISAAIDKIRNSYPYNQKTLLEDIELVQQKAEEYKNILADYESTCASLEQRLKEML